MSILSLIACGALVRFIFRRYGAKGVVYLWASALGSTGLILMAVH